MRPNIPVASTKNVLFLESMKLKLRLFMHLAGARESRHRGSQAGYNCFRAEAD
jgi:hypothetical protein